MKITQPNQIGQIPGGGVPGGPAGGDLAGGYPGPTVVGIQGTPVCVTAPVLGDVLTFDGTEWCPAGSVGPGSFLTSTYGEQGDLIVEPAAGATYDIDCSLANTFDITLTANCTLTISNPAPTGVDSHIVVILRQGGSGSYTVTWPGSVVWQDPTDGTTGGAAPTLWTAIGAQNVIELSTEDGGVTWGGNSGNAGSALTIKDEGTPLATAATSIDFTGAGVTASGATAAKTVTIPGYTDAQVLALLPPSHVHVDNVVFSGDGSTTVFILPAAPVDAYSIGVYVTGSRSLDWTLSGALLDTLTFGSAPASAANNIVIDIAAAL